MLLFATRTRRVKKRFLESAKSKAWPISFHDFGYRDTHAPEQAVARQRFTEQLVQVDLEAQALRVTAQSAVVAVTEKLQEFDKPFSDLQWQWTKKASKAAKFAHISFWRFLLKLYFYVKDVLRDGD